MKSAYGLELDAAVYFCNLCGEPTDEATLEHVEDRYGFRTMSVRCDCGLSYLSRRLSAESYATFYSQCYRPLLTDYHGAQYDAQTIQSEQARYAASVGEFLDPCLMSGKVAIDIGGSTGIVAEHVAARFNKKAVVIDPCQDELDIAARRGCVTICSTIEHVELDGEFAVVLLCRTVDHLLDIRGALDKIREVVVPGASFFVDCLDYKKTRETKLDHPYNLTDETMRRYLVQAGFTVCKMAEHGKHLRYLCR